MVSKKHWSQTNLGCSTSSLGFPGGSDCKKSAWNAGDLGLIPGLGRFPQRTDRLPTPVFWPGEFHGLYSPWGCKESETTEQFSLSLHQFLILRKGLYRISITAFFITFKNPPVKPSEARIFLVGNFLIKSLIYFIDMPTKVIYFLLNELVTLLTPLSFLIW